MFIIVSLETIHYDFAVWINEDRKNLGMADRYIYSALDNVQFGSGAHLN